MNEDFKRAMVICSAVGTFAAAAYTGGNAVVHSFDQAVKASVARVDSAEQAAASDAGSAESMQPPSSTSILPKKFGVTIER